MQAVVAEVDRQYERWVYFGSKQRIHRKELTRRPVMLYVIRVCDVQHRRPTAVNFQACNRRKLYALSIRLLVLLEINELT